MTTYYRISIKTAPHSQWGMPSGWGPYDSRADAERALAKAEHLWMSAKIVEHDGPVWAVLDIRGEQRYGRVVSIHSSQLDADLACKGEIQRQTAGMRNVLPHLMWTVAEVDGTIGERVPYEVQS